MLASRNPLPMRLVNTLLLVLMVLLSASGCTRTRYRTAADRDSYQIVREKEAALTHPIPAGYSIRPDQRSRFYDPTNPDCPQLPVPRPVLYGYDLPALASDNYPCQDQVVLPALASASTNLDTVNSDGDPSGPALRPAPLPSSVPLPEVGPTLQGAVPPGAVIPALHSHNDPQAVVPTSFGVTEGTAVIQIAEPPKVPATETPATPPAQEPGTQEPPAQEPGAQEPPKSNGNTFNRVTIPARAWQVLPQSCLVRMLEFPSLRDEYSATFPDEKLDPDAQGARTLTLANLMELATINSREYQGRKELLFRAALALTRQRYQFELNPSPFNNGTITSYRHSRVAGITENRLSVPSSVGVQRTLATGGQFLARFANSVVLTFNGPTGFATDIGSEILLDFQQTLFQRDVQFEQLTQTERDVVYAARDYLRFRKQLFRDISNQYYNLLVSFRGIEINAQDYFTNLRGFIQSQVEYRTAEKISRIQVDQFEQNVLRTRSNLVNNCFALEAALDQLKFRLGLPTEIALNLSLAELESISLKDELSVARQMIGRARTELINSRTVSSADSTTLANVAEVLADRMKNILRIQARMEENARTSGMEVVEGTQLNAQAIAGAERELTQLRHLLKILGVRMQVDILRAELDTQVNSETPAPALRVLIRAVDLCSSEMQVIDLALDGPDVVSQPAIREQLIARRNVLNQKLESMLDFLDQLSSKIGSKVDVANIDLFDTIPIRMKESVTLADEISKLADESTKGLLPQKDESMEAKVLMTVDKTIELSDRLLEKGPDGWQEIVLDHDEALLTGLVQRLDLMNQRGELADIWRQIKLTGDDLRSIVDLQTTHLLRTNSKDDNPFDFTFDDSETRVTMALDTPLNRRLQRNNFRLALINYNVGLRNLMAAEDTIKLDVREDLRQLALDRNQYTIAVASAALAYERVISTQLRLQLAVPGVQARDFLEAQQAYTNSLSQIARQHVNYITDRIELFFDLEAFDVDNCGYWPGVQGDFGPQTNVDFPGTNPRPYDTLPPRVHYSPTIRQMENIPPGNAIIR